VSSVDLVRVGLKARWELLVARRLILCCTIVVPVHCLYTHYQPRCKLFDEQCVELMMMMKGLYYCDLSSSRSIHGDVLMDTAAHIMPRHVTAIYPYLSVPEPKMSSSPSTYSQSILHLYIMLKRIARQSSRPLVAACEASTSKLPSMSRENNLSGCKH
jgi:hypothetical protein